MRSCETYREQISMLLDGELTEAEEEAVRRHIASCPECREMFEAFCALRDAVSSDSEELPETLHAGIMARVNAAEKATKTHGRLMRLRRDLISAACLVVIVGTVFALTKGKAKTAAHDTASESMAMMMAPPAAGAAYMAETAEADAEEICMNSAAEEVPAALEPKPEPESTSEPAEFEAIFHANTLKSANSEDAAVNGTYNALTIRVTGYTDRGLSGEILSCDKAEAAEIHDGDSVEVILPEQESAGRYAVGEELTVAFSTISTENGICVSAEEIY